LHRSTDLIFIASNVNKFLDISKEVVVSVCIPPLIGFSLLKHMKELAMVALVADVMNILGLAIVLQTDLTYMPLDHDRIEVFGVLSSVPFFFGVASYCFEGVGMVLPLENSMLHKENFTPILLATVGIITTLYAAFGVCGYLAFGDATEDVITLNFEGSSSMAMAVKLCLCIGLFFTYPVMLYPVFEVLLPTLSCGPSEGGSSRTSEVKSALLRSAIVLLTGVLAAGIPSTLRVDCRVEVHDLEPAFSPCIGRLRRVHLVHRLDVLLTARLHPTRELLPAALPRRAALSASPPTQTPALHHDPAGRRRARRRRL